MALAVCSCCAASVPVPGRQLKFTGQSARAVPIRVLTVGKARSRGVRLIVDEYMEKLKCYCTIEDIQIRPNPKNSRDIKIQIAHEDMSAMHLIRSDDWVVMLDERGLDITSEKMAQLIREAGNTRASSLLFCIGGPYGHGEQLRQRANVSIKLSSLVLNHQIALVVLMEQIYRRKNFHDGVSELVHIGQG